MATGCAIPEHIANYALQANSARYIYTLSPREPQHVRVKLINGYFINREPKSDEKLLYTETELFSFIRTVMTMILFQTYPLQPINEIIYTGEVTFSEPIFEPTNLSFLDCITTLDKLFGNGFTSVAVKPTTKFYAYYKTRLQFVPYGKRILLPSAWDCVALYRFLNTSNPTYSPSTRFIIDNANANKILWQQEIKHLD